MLKFIGSCTLPYWALEAIALYCLSTVTASLRDALRLVLACGGKSTSGSLCYQLYARITFCPITQGLSLPVSPSTRHGSNVPAIGTRVLKPSSRHLSPSSRPIDRPVHEIGPTHRQ
eukprot:1748245-Pleurochrysis_carterae.AAC.1